MYERVKDRRIVDLYNALAHDLVSGGGNGRKVHKIPNKLTVLMGTVQMIKDGKVPDETFEEQGIRCKSSLESSLQTLMDIRTMGFRV
jgi:hypothetical protein